MQMFKWRSLLSPFPLQLSWASFSGWMEWGDGGGGGGEKPFSSPAYEQTSLFWPTLAPCLPFTFFWTLYSLCVNEVALGNPGNRKKCP